ncbi:unnamed protein product [Didymodactylos carnosus]|uniref:Uncharacterized protein n=1 Tax=Didymodactylos carnosus TaxID=1234261 RepID=A0A815FQG0_9BILA|nr:unnamed protein product [Didymodactylos carnosus]CAF4182043.1 unnamed protein product [Didymodactylos carnosus]
MVSSDFLLRAVDSFLNNAGRTDICVLRELIQDYLKDIKISHDIEFIKESIKADILEKFAIEKNRSSLLRDHFLYSFSVPLSEQNNRNNDKFDNVASYRHLGTPARAAKRNIDMTEHFSDDSTDSGKRINKRWKEHIDERKEKFMELKDTFNLTDASIAAIGQYLRKYKTFFSWHQTRQLRKKLNTKFAIKLTESGDAAYVDFAYAITTAIYVAESSLKKQDSLKNLNKLEKLTCRISMDGILVGNKHIIAMWVNSVDGGVETQTAKLLVPLGVFQVTHESNEIIKNVIPAHFREQIKALKFVHYNGRDILVTKFVEGDMMNFVYIMGLAGFNSNHPCVWCTVSKEDLKQPDLTSCYDTGKKARSLFEQKMCLKDVGAKGKKTADYLLGYKCTPVFDDLFDFSDYVIDTLHMKLRVYDYILDGILSRASQQTSYGQAHIQEMEKKIEILNEYVKEKIGKRVWFNYGEEEKTISRADKAKGIRINGKLGGDLQDILFESFPYDKILKEPYENDARNIVARFQGILRVLKKPKQIRRNIDLKKLRVEFLDKWNKSNLRTGVTPYIHSIGNHVFEFDEKVDLKSFNMQGVEKGNDRLSRLYFSSTNPAKKPILTLM